LSPPPDPVLEQDQRTGLPSNQEAGYQRVIEKQGFLAFSAVERTDTDDEVVHKKADGTDSARQQTVPPIDMNQYGLPEVDDYATA
jgi:hypothetical protein